VHENRLHSTQLPKPKEKKLTAKQAFHNECLRTIAEARRWDKKKADKMFAHLDAEIAEKKELLKKLQLQLANKKSVWSETRH